MWPLGRERPQVLTGRGYLARMRVTTWSVAVGLLLGAAVAVVAPPPAAPVEAAATASVVCDDRPGTEPAPTPALDSYTAINPTRLVDTRDGTGGVTGALGRGCTLRLDLTDSVVPDDADAVGISLTSRAETRGYLTAHPCAAGRPGTSNLNARVGIGTPNFVVGLLDSSRTLCIYSSAGSHVIVDLAGWWSPGGDRITNMDPVRAYDTRELPGSPKLPANAIRNVPIGGPVVPDEATAAIVNLTATDAEAQGWVSVYPCGNTPPLSSNLNLKPGEARAVTAIIGLGRSGPAKGQLCIQSNITSHVIVDVNGYYAPAPVFGPAAAVQPQVGVRLADSRFGTGGWSTPFRAGEIRSFDPVAGSPLASSAAGVMLNVTSAQAPGRGNLRVYPCTTTSPAAVTETSAVNFTAEGAAANLVPVSLSSSRRVCVYASRPTDVVIDLFAVVTAPEGSLAERLSFGEVAAWPPFDPEGTDYGIRCPAATNSLELDLDLLPNTTARVDGVAVPAGTSTRPMATDDLLRVRLQRGNESQDHWFRCLPPDFPVYEVERPGDPAPGWYLTTAGAGSSPSGDFTIILDEYGAPVWYKRVEERMPNTSLEPPSFVLLNFQRLPDGRLSASEIGNRYGVPEDDVRHRISDLDGKYVVRGLGSHPTLSDAEFIQRFPIDHHDYADLPDGGYALVSYPLRQNVDLTGLGDGFDATDSVLDGAILEFDSNGDLVWEWNTKDHFPEDFSSFPQRRGTLPGWPQRYPDAVAPGGEVDTVHINSFQKLGDEGDGCGDYVVSARHYDAVFRVDCPSGTVEWILGGKTETVGPGPDVSAEQLEIVGDPFGGLLRPHDARLDGNLLTVFDNRTATDEPARAVTYEITGTTATLVREILQPDGRSSPAQGSHRVGADGSALISWGVLQPNFQEYDASGNLLLSIGQVNPVSGLPDGFSYRIVKEPPTSFDRTELREKAGGTAQAP